MPTQFSRASTIQSAGKKLGDRLKKTGDKKGVKAGRQETKISTLRKSKRKTKKWGGE